MQFPMDRLRKQPAGKETLERLKRWPKVKSNLNGESVHIYSAEHGAYWRTGACGYTLDTADAGIWSVDDAFKKTRHCCPKKKIEFHSLSFEA